MADTWSLFDVIGPVMVGPSSSHTAGASKLGLMARIIFGEPINEIVLHLHGSFATVFKGHCTDKALVAGLLGMKSNDPKLRDSINIAKEKGISVILKRVDLGPDAHPNSILFELTNKNKKMMIEGASIGGGKARITSIDKIKVKLQGEYSLFLIMANQSDVKIVDVMNIIAKKATIVDVKTAVYKNRCIWDIEVKEYFDRDTVKEIEKLDGVQWARFINHESHYDY